MKGTKALGEHVCAILVLLGAITVTAAKDLRGPGGPPSFYSGGNWQPEKTHSDFCAREAVSALSLEANKATLMFLTLFMIIAQEPF